MRVQGGCSIAMGTISRETTSYHKNKGLAFTNGRIHSMRDSSKKTLWRGTHASGFLSRKAMKAAFETENVMAEEFIDTVMEICSKGNGRMITRF